MSPLNTDTSFMEKASNGQVRLENRSNNELWTRRTETTSNDVAISQMMVESSPMDEALMPALITPGMRKIQRRAILWGTSQDE